MPDRYVGGQGCAAEPGKSPAAIITPTNKGTNNPKDNPEESDSSSSLDRSFFQRTRRLLILLCDSVTHAFELAPSQQTRLTDSFSFHMC